jgi:PAS domain S-box-containing protein
MMLTPDPVAPGRPRSLLRQSSRHTALVLTAVTAALVVLLAAAGLVLAWREYQRGREAVRVDTKLLARAAAADSDRFLRDRVDTLTSIANSPTVRSGDPGAMQAYFRALAIQPTFARLSWFDLTGTRRASSVDDPPTGPLVVSSRVYFQRVVATAMPFVDAAVTSLQDGSPVIAIAVPTFDADGHLSGVLLNPITLDVLEDTLSTFQRPDALVVVIDRANQVVADANPGTGYTPVADAPVVARARTQGSGTMSGVTGPTGSKNQVLGFAPAPTGNWVVFIARSADAAFAPARRTLLIELGTIVGIVVIGIGGALWLGRRLRREAAAQRQAQETAERLAAIVDSSDDAIIGLTLEGVITSWNASATQIFGLAAADARGRPVWSLVRSDRAAELRTLLGSLSQGRGVRQYETVGVRSDGVLIDLALTLSPVRTSTHVAVGASVIGRDITQQKRVEADRELLLQREHAARAEAEATNRAKDEFLSLLSHELRTPLTPIVAGAQLLQRRPDVDPRVAEIAATIERGGRVQQRLVNDLLDISRVITGKLEIMPEPISLPELVDAAVRTMQPEATARDIRLEAQVDPQVGFVLGDAERLQQVLANLLGNALKFTPPSGWVTVTLERAGKEAQLVVRDSGMGISAEFLPHVFERFRQADASSTRAYGGLGLGLSIVRTLVELHGGRVTAASDGEGCGATFTVWLPLIESVPADNGSSLPAAVAQQEPMSPALAGWRLLLVEDDAATRELLQRTLEAEGATVVAAAGSADALAALDRCLPDVMLCDIGMPDEDGYTFMRKVRARDAHAGGCVPAIAVTAYASPADREQALAAGFTQHLGKPVTTTALVTAIATACQASSGVAAAIAQSD